MKTQTAREELLAFALPRWAAEPAMEIADAYKWLYQATQGGEHAVGDLEGAQRWLEQEWVALGPPLPDEPLVEPLRPDGAVVRLHLRPYRTAGGEAAALLGAFVASAATFPPERAAFTSVWRQLGEHLAQASLGALTREKWARLDAAMAIKGYPAEHHSSAYRAARQSAYRVLTASQHLALLKR
jgi:hypothetical protein